MTNNKVAAVYKERGRRTSSMGQQTKRACSGPMQHQKDIWPACLAQQQLPQCHMHLGLSRRRLRRRHTDIAGIYLPYQCQVSPTVTVVFRDSPRIHNFLCMCRPDPASAALYCRACSWTHLHCYWRGGVPVLSCMLGVHRHFAILIPSQARTLLIICRSMRCVRACFTGS